MTFTGNIIYDILAYLLLIGLTWASIKLAQFFGVRLTSGQRSLIEGFVKNVVIFVQQKYEELDGEEKFDKAYEAISEWLATKKINLTADEIEIMIESALKKAKDEFADSWSKTKGKDEVNTDIEQP